MQGTVEMHTGYWSGNVKERDHLEDLSLHSRIKNCKIFCVCEERVCYFHITKYYKACYTFLILKSKPTSILYPGKTEFVYIVLTLRHVSPWKGLFRTEHV
jgi:hypothetical protein